MRSQREHGALSAVVEFLDLIRLVQHREHATVDARGRLDDGGDLRLRRHLYLRDCAG